MATGTCVSGTAAISWPMLSPVTPIVATSVGIGGAVVALVSTLYFTAAVLNEEQGNAEMVRLRGLIYDGARAYLLTQYKWLSLWVLALFVMVSVLLGPVTDSVHPIDGVYTGLSFVVGALFSAGAGYAGMLIATQANSRTTEACKQSISRGLEVSFASGAVMGNAVVGLGLMGLIIFYLIFTYSTPGGDRGDAILNAAGCIVDWDTASFARVFNRLAGFGFGASTIGMFARVGGGVFTKAADVGSDLVGKVEQGIPEDDPRNPAVIADNVGDNVGDVAGMGADLFESYAGAVIATATLAPRLAEENFDKGLGSVADMVTEYNLLLMAGVALPFAIDGFGIVASLIGTALVRNAKLDDSTTLETLLTVITNGVWLASALTLASSALCVGVLFKAALAWKLFGAIAIGLVAGIIIAKWTEYCTSYTDPPTRDIAAASEYGPAPVIIKGLGVGMFSVAIPTIAIAITILGCDALAGQYGVAISAVGLLSTLGITLATDAYGPVADNAGGIAEMANLEAYVRVRTDALDALGNTTAATGKGLAIASATLTAVGLIAAFVEQSGLARAANPGANAARIVDLTDSLVLTGVLIGSCLPYIFAALTMLSVDRGARAIITEVRLQFATAPLLMRGSLTQIVDGHLYPDSTRCVQIATTAAIQEMVLPGVLAVFVPVAIGFILGPKGFTGLMAGVLGGCFMLALTMATSGGAWDNAKKYSTSCANEGQRTGKKDKGPITFTNYGIKNARDFPALFREHGINAFITDPSTARQYDSPEGLARLQNSLSELYHARHAAVVIGDTIGDPFKDTSGPSLNVLTKTVSMLGLMLAPAYLSFGEFSGFGPTGSTIGSVMLVVLGLGCYFLVSHFRKLNAIAFNEAVTKKRAADAKIAAGFYGDASADNGAHASERDGLNTPLMRV